MKNTWIFLTLLSVLIGGAGCTMHWTKAVQKGKWVNNNRVVKVPMETQNNLIIVPVVVHGNTYRFLLDTGAPFSISKELQEKLQYPIISKGNIVDSDNNREAILWAKVDSISIGEAVFVNQSAFIGDFKANPLLACLELDGIIGSNLMRQCNWTIDPVNQQLTLFQDPPQRQEGDLMEIPFKPNKQYSMFASLPIGQSTVNSVLIDYGSNSMCSMNPSIFEVLAERNAFHKVWVEKGTKQSGIIGKPVAINRQITQCDSLLFDSVRINPVLVRTSKTTSIGNGLLKHFIVTIDWSNHRLLLEPTDKKIPTLTMAGFSIGVRANQQLYIQSLVNHSTADSLGMRTHMQVVKFNGLDFEQGATFCDFFTAPKSDTLYLECRGANGQPYTYQLERTFVK
jgi:hypothetical protein